VLYNLFLCKYICKYSSSFHLAADAGLAVLDRAFLTLAGI
jgi:hypothetical protein